MAVDITAVSTDNFTQLSIFTELQDAHASLLTRHAYVEGTCEEYDRKLRLLAARWREGIGAQLVQLGGAEVAPRLPWIA